MTENDTPRLPKPLKPWIGRWLIYCFACWSSFAPGFAMLFADCGLPRFWDWGWHECITLYWDTFWETCQQSLLMEVVWYIARFLIGTAAMMWFQAAFAVSRLARVYVSLIVLFSVLGEWPLPDFQLLTSTNSLLLHAIWVSIAIILALLYRLLRSKMGKGYTVHVAVVGWALITLFIMLRLPIGLLVFILLCDPDEILLGTGVSEDFKTGAKIVLFWTITMNLLGPNVLTGKITMAMGLLMLSLAIVPMVLQFWNQNYEEAA